MDELIYSMSWLGEDFVCTGDDFIFWLQELWESATERSFGFSTSGVFIFWAGRALNICGGILIFY